MCCWRAPASRCCASSAWRRASARRWGRYRKRRCCLRWAPIWVSGAGVFRAGTRMSSRRRVALRRAGRQQAHLHRREPRTPDRARSEHLSRPNRAIRRIRSGWCDTAVCEQGMTAMDDVIGYARAVLAATPERWRALTKTIPSDLLGRAPKTGEWSALDCLRHLVDTERWVFPVRVRAFLAGEDFAAFDPDAEGSHSGQQPAAALAEELARLREGSLALLGELAAADLE